MVSERKKVSFGGFASSVGMAASSISKSCLAGAIFSMVALVLSSHMLYSFSSSFHPSSHKGNNGSTQTLRPSYGSSAPPQLRIEPYSPPSSSHTPSFHHPSLPTPLPDRCLVFWHVKKTGGTTLRHILLKDSQLRNRTFSWQQGFTGRFTADVIVGHAPVSRIIIMLETSLIAADCYWMMSLRDPLERFISRFYFKRRWGDSVEDFVLNSSNSKLRSFRLLTDQEEFRRLSTMLPRFNLIVLTEQFDESLLLLMEEDRMIGEEVFLHYTNFGILQGRPKASDLSAKVRGRLTRLLRLDILLYRLAKRLWEEKVRRSKFGGEEGLRTRLKALQTEKGVYRGCAEKGDRKAGGSGNCKEFSQLGINQE
ncbi:hypothetical protein QOT17_014344 [Balamuthia mandrillaris]